MRDFLSFKKMLMPVAIQLIFWLGSLTCIVAGIALIFLRHKIPNGLAVIFLAPIVLRLACEIIIVFFRINQTLKNIEDQIDQAIYAQPGSLSRPGDGNSKSSLFDLVTANKSVNTTDANTDLS